jgi:hypothetical protein
MLGRALSLATVTLLTGWFAMSPVWAQTQNLEAGKSPSQIFAGTCNACHKSPRGLLKTVSPGSLPGFLRQHYTTSGDMASTLSSYLVSNGASDTRGGRDKPSTEPKPAEARSSAGSDQPDRQGRKMRPGSQEAAKPDADGSAQGEPARQGRKRLARPGEGPDETKPAVDGQAPAQAGDDRKLSSKRQSKRGRPGGEEQPKPDTAKTDEAPKAEPAKDDKPKSETAKEESGKPEGTKPAGEGKPEPAKSSEPPKSEAAKSEPAKSEPAKTDNSGAPPVLRADPVPPVTPAPPAQATPSAAAASGTPAPPAAQPSAPAPAPPPAVTASAPPPPPAPAPASNAGPPAPPISQ